jgi:hypothetical protein
MNSTTAKKGIKYQGEFKGNTVLIKELFIKIKFTLVNHATNAKLKLKLKVVVTGNLYSTIDRVFNIVIATNPAINSIECLIPKGNIISITNTEGSILKKL